MEGCWDSRPWQPSILFAYFYGQSMCFHTFGFCKLNDGISILF